MVTYLHVIFCAASMPQEEFIRNPALAEERFITEAQSTSGSQDTVGALLTASLVSAYGGRFNFSIGKDFRNFNCYLMITDDQLGCCLLINY